MKYHIEDLRDQLHNHNWIVLKESEGNDLDISEFWTIRHRYQPNKTCTLAFEGMDDLEVLPIEKRAWGASGVCHARTSNKREAVGGFRRRRIYV